MVRSVFFSGLLIITFAACGGDNKGVPCTATADCASGLICASGFCISSAKACDASNPCPGSLACCGNVCSETACCQADVDCLDGYCNGSSCQTGERPACSTDIDCNGVGVCVASLGFCAECEANGDCASGYTCSPQHTCSAVSGCTQAACLAQGTVCAPEQGQCRDCVSTAECGSKICDNGKCVDCVASNQCGDDRQCKDGSCSAGQGVACGTDADCGGLVCTQNGNTKTCEPCFADYECGAGVCGPDHRCVIADGECAKDADCGAPAKICVLGICNAGCTTASCANGDLCNPSTGRCVPFSDGTIALGDPCNTHGQCLTNVCWPLDTSPTTAIRRCGLSCSTSADCPSGTHCYELGDGGTCVKNDFPAPGGNYNVAAGGVCQETFESTTCTSGFCNGTADTCYERCSDTADCAQAGDGLVCTLRRTVPHDTDGDGTVEQQELTFTALCEAPPVGTLAVGALCTQNGNGPTDRDHDKCVAGFCAQTPDTTKAPRCAGGCCTPSDCTPSSPICKPIDVWDGIRQGGANDQEPYGFQKICLTREFSGAKKLGDACQTNAECASEICAEGVSGTRRCTQTCCTNTDCAGFSWSSGCRPPFYDSATSTGEESVADDQFDQIVHALGRKVVPSSNGTVAFGVSPLCFPE